MNNINSELYLKRRKDIQRRTYSVYDVGSLNEVAIHTTPQFQYEYYSLSSGYNHSNMSGKYYSEIK